MEHVEQYWIFATFGLGVCVVLLALVLREHITLQGSLSYLLFLLVLSTFALFPGPTTWVAQRLGFQLGSNFLFVLTIGMLAFLHLMALVTLSRVELRTVVLTQELGILQEQVSRLREAQEATRSSSEPAR